jgi:hypothetical protein
MGPLQRGESVVLGLWGWRGVCFLVFFWWKLSFSWSVWAWRSALFEWHKSCRWKITEWLIEHVKSLCGRNGLSSCMETWVVSQEQKGLKLNTQYKLLNIFSIYETKFETTQNSNNTMRLSLLFNFWDFCIHVIEQICL